MDESVMVFSLLLAVLLGQCAAADRDVHAFYYLWYGNPEVDGKYCHWNHEVLPHWTAAVNRQYSEVGLYFDPDKGNLHSPFFPSLGAYSSRDANTIRQHFSYLKRANVNVIAVSWWGQAEKPESTDNQGISTDRTVSLLLDLADETVTDDGEGVFVCFHMEPYPGRTAMSTLKDLEYIYEQYGHHPSLARRNDGRVIIYIYDSYHISPTDWAQVFSASGQQSIRTGGPFSHLNSFVLGLWLDNGHGEDLVTAGFDGFYTYFASDGFSYGSTSSNWRRMCSFAREHNLLCTVSVGPGYQDDKIRPWNSMNTKSRREGGYYDEMWRRAIDAGAEMVSITSFNEWGEGTQIEPVSQTPPSPPSSLQSYSSIREVEASPISVSGDVVRQSIAKPVPREYLTYGSLGSYGYIDKTAKWVKMFRHE